MSLPRWSQLLPLPPILLAPVETDNYKNNQNQRHSLGRYICTFVYLYAHLFVCCSVLFFYILEFGISLGEMKYGRCISINVDDDALDTMCSLTSQCMLKFLPSAFTSVGYISYGYFVQVYYWCKGDKHSAFLWNNLRTSIVILQLQLKASAFLLIIDKTVCSTIILFGLSSFDIYEDTCKSTCIPWMIYFVS